MQHTITALDSQYTVIHTYKNQAELTHMITTRSSILLLLLLLLLITTTIIIINNILIIVIITHVMHCFTHYTVNDLLCLPKFNRGSSVLGWDIPAPFFFSAGLLFFPLLSISEWGPRLPAAVWREALHKTSKLRAALIFPLRSSAAAGNLSGLREGRPTDQLGKGGARKKPIKHMREKRRLFLLLAEHCVSIWCSFRLPRQ